MGSCAPVCWASHWLFSVCVYNSHSVGTHWRTCCHFLPSVSFSLGFSVCFNLAFCLYFSVIYVFVPPVLWVASFSLVLWPEALCKATRKRLLAMPVCASVLYSFQELLFLFCDLQSDLLLLHTHYNLNYYSSRELKTKKACLLVLFLSLYLPTSLTW